MLKCAQTTFNAQAFKCLKKNVISLKKVSISVSNLSLKVAELKVAVEIVIDWYDWLIMFYFYTEYAQNIE